MQYTRENYIQDRKNNMVNFELAWEMFQKSDIPNKSNLTKDEFIRDFNVWIRSGLASMNLYFEYFDRVFEIGFLIDKNNKLINLI